MVNSHIQMPRQIMKNFINKNGQLYFYDFVTDDIHMGHPKTMYRKESM